MEISIHTKLSRVLLILRGAVSMVELEGLQIASILTKHGDIDLSLAFHEIGNALYLAQDTVTEAIQALEKPEQLPQHSGNARQ